MANDVKSKKKSYGHYSIFYPEVNFQPSQNYFYFSHLLINQKQKGQQKPANELGKSAYNYLNQGFQKLENLEDNQQLNIIQQSMNFLKQLIDLCKRNENAWLQKKINEKNVPLKIRQKLKAIFDQSKEINGIELITYINYIENTIESYQQQINFELQRRKIFEKYANQIPDILKSTEESEAKQQLQKIYNTKNVDENILKDRATQFLMRQELEKGCDMFFHKEMTDIQQYLNGRLTQQVADYLDLVYQTLINNEEYLNRFLEIFQGKSLKTIEEKENFIAIILPILAQESVKGINLYFRSFLQDIYSGKFYDKNDKEKEKMAENTLKSILYPGAAVINKKRVQENLEQMLNNLNFFKELGQTILNDRQTMENIAKRFRTKDYEEITTAEHQRIINGKEQAYTTLQNLTEQQILKLEKALKQNNIKLYQPIKESAIPLSKREIIKRTLITIVQETMQTEEKKISRKDVTFQQIADAANKFLKPSIIFGKHPSTTTQIEDMLSINNTAYGDLFTYGLNHPNERNNLRRISLGQLKIPLNFPKKAFQQIAQDLIASCFNIPHTFSKKINLRPLEKIYNEKKDREQEGFSSQSYFLKGETEKMYRSFVSAFLTLKSATVKEKKIAYDLSFFINGIRNSMIEEGLPFGTNSMRNGDQFSGPRFGGTLLEQLKNILFMAESGGIKNIDLQWLQFAILNSSDSNVLIGSSEQKKQLEGLLSIFSAGLFFKSTAFQFKWYADQYKILSNKITPNFFRYVKIQENFYIPLSFLLQKIYDSLLGAQANLESLANDTSSGIKIEINNNMNWTNVSGERTNGHTITTSTEDWINTRDNNLNEIQLSIVFLAGFTDLLQKMHDFQIKF